MEAIRNYLETMFANLPNTMEVQKAKRELGQMMEDIELAIRCKKPVELCNRVGGMIPSPEEVLAKIIEANGGNN